MKSSEIFESRRFLSIFLFSFLMIFWLVFADFYRNSIIDSYRYCVLQNSPEQFRLQVDIYENQQLRVLRENCAASQGRGLFLIGEDIAINLSQFPVGEALVMWPTVLIRDWVSW